MKLKLKKFAEGADKFKECMVLNKVRCVGVGITKENIYSENYKSFI
jgi:hypothetical protein